LPKRVLNNAHKYQEIMMITPVANDMTVCAKINRTHKIYSHEMI